MTRTTFLMIVMSCMAVTVGGTAMVLLYRADLGEHRRHLVETVRTQARLIEAIARHEREVDRHGEAQARENVLEHVRTVYGQRSDTTVILVQRQDGGISVLLGTFTGPVPPDHPLADPMRRVLAGQSGALVVDMESPVLVAHEPVMELGWGVVAHVELAEIRTPFLHAGLVVLAAALGVITLAAFAFLRMIDLPEMRRQAAERERLITALHTSEQRLREILDNTTAVIFMKDLEGRYLFINRQYEKLFHVGNAMIQGKSDYDIFPAEIATRFQTNDRQCLASDAPILADEMAPQDDGVHYYISVKFPLRDSQGHPYAVCGIATDVTERRQAQAALLREKEIHAVLARLGRDLLTCKEIAVEEMARLVLTGSQEVTASPFGFVGEVDPQTGWLVVRGMTPEIYALCQVADQSLVFRERRGLWGWVLEHGQPLLTNTPGEHPASSGTPEGHVPIERFLAVPVLSGGLVVGLIAVANADLDYMAEDQAVLERIAALFAMMLDRIKLERHVRHMQRLDAIGTLSAGIAHDFNNILGTILGYAEMVLDKVTPQDAIHHHLEAIQQAGLRGQGLVEQLLQFSRREEGIRRPVRLARLIRGVEKFLRGTIPPSIAITIRLAQDDLEVVGSPTQVYQILMNLCINAWQAIENSQGQITITVERRTVSTHMAINLPPGEYALIQVRDTGVGIPPEILERIFDPFFTTKEVGKGTGLGLSVIHGIVANHHGTILVESTVGTGTLFQVYLPLLNTEV